MINSSGGSRILQQGQQLTRERGQEKHLNLEDLIGSWLSAPVCSLLIHSILCPPWNLTASVGQSQLVLFASAQGS